MRNEIISKSRKENAGTSRVIGLTIKEVRLKKKKQEKKKKKKKGCEECKKPFDQSFKGQRVCGECLDGYL